MNTFANKTGVMDMRKSVGRLLLMAIASLPLAAAGPAVQAAELSEAELFFELNNTDEDLGIHASIDGEAYSRLKIEDPKGRRILFVRAKGRLARQGLTQLFLESAEPTFGELDPEEFFLRFPEGEYEIEAKSLEGEELEGSVELSHVMAAPVGNVMVNTESAAENCDVVPLPSVSEPVIIDWDPVTTSHPTVGESGAVDIVKYQFFVEQGDFSLAMDLPPTLTQFQVPLEITAQGGEFKFEIIARTATGNNTAVESCFTLQ